MQDAAAIAGAGPSAATLGPLEAVHLRSQNYRNAADNTRITATHWHIAWANGLGWGFDGMDGAILALVAPLLMKEFAIDLGTYRSGVQIALFVSIVGLYLWPWLADKFGRRNILALNIAVFSLAMPLVALSPGWGSFVLIYSIVRFELKKVRGGTRLVFDQTGLPPEHVGHLSSGWKARYWTPLKAYLEKQ